MSLSLYNKYRPTDLDMIIGQEPVKRILRSQVNKEDIAHAYLFVGSAGTGKTTVARIFAAMINDSAGMTIHPNLEDERVKRIFSGRSAVDVVELDAASNGKVEDAREIKRSTEYGPQDMRYKVIILDECHAMSPQAWQALLKVIEEPPEYAVFIFCTTEDDKVPDTIKTRSMVFRFISLTAKEIFSRLKMISESEKISVSDEILRMISAGAKGSVRMAIKALEHVASSDEGIKPEDVTAALGIPNKESAKKFVNSLVIRDSTGRPDFLGALEASSSSVTSGILPEDFMSAVAEYCHDLMMCRSPAFDMEHYGYGEEEVKGLIEAREKIEALLPEKKIFLYLARKWINTVNEAAKLVVYRQQPQSQLDVLWVNMLFELADMSGKTS